MRKRENLTALEVLILVGVQSSRERWIRGLDLQKRIAEDTSQEIPTGTFYVMLTRLEKRGFLEKKRIPAPPGVGGPARRHVRLTAEGNRVLRNVLTDIETMRAAPVALRAA